MNGRLSALQPSAHLYEGFMPLAASERLFCDVLRKIPEIGFYRGIETGVFFEPQSLRDVRRLREENGWRLTMWATPWMLLDGLNLSSLDETLRARSVRRAIELVALAAETGASHFGLPSGSDPGDADREQAKTLLFESLSQIAEKAAQYEGMRILLEPLDRYAHKKQLIGPMRESMEWFAPLHAQHPNLLIHWDSAHEALGGIDLVESLQLAKPYLAQFHLCNAILDPVHPLYGDLHMDIGSAPGFETDGYLTPDVAARILADAAACRPIDGDRPLHVAVEMRAHLGDDMWQKERTSRAFLQEAFRRADERMSE